ncbi:hypothetical protein KJ855_04635 [Patescibacteria group bacterium]|nr:hypothetical protein [Patescibacteria group bacterium]
MQKSHQNILITCCVIIVIALVISAGIATWGVYLGSQEISKLVEEEQKITEYNNEAVQIRDGIVFELEYLTDAINNAPTTEEVSDQADLLENEIEKFETFIKNPSPSPELDKQHQEYLIIAKNIVNIAREIVSLEYEGQNTDNEINNYNDEIDKLNDKNQEIADFIGASDTFEYDYKPDSDYDYNFDFNTA